MSPLRESEIVEVPNVKYPRSGARLWHGMTTGKYLQLLGRNGFRVAFLRWAMAFLITIVSTANTLLAWVQSWLLSKRIHETAIDHPPIFVVGHWRSGTTLLHELLSLDPNHTYPTTYECFAPRHFLISSSWVPKLCRFALPSKRPMDSMSVDFDSPQEDEFALVSMGCPSPYFRLAFPNDPPPFEEFYNMSNANPQLVKEFDVGLEYFFKALTLKRKKRLILKSPTHTGRIDHLQKLFPGSIFIHISRNPLKQISSTMQMWMIMDNIQGFQPPRYSQDDLLEHSFLAFEKMYDEGFLKQIERIPESNRIEIRFEDLIADPEREIEKIYEQFSLPNVEGVKTKVSEYFAARTNYKRNKHELSDETKSRIRSACSKYMERYEYS